jgi:LmbE family N-acetylglucosaminyl deacetylase
MMAKSMSCMPYSVWHRAERGREVATKATTTNNLKLMCVVAHPYEETLGTGGILAKYAAEGVERYLVTATHGECGWSGSKDSLQPLLASAGGWSQLEGVLHQRVK